jgi:hypothetical protein
MFGRWVEVVEESLVEGMEKVRAVEEVRSLPLSKNTSVVDYGEMDLMLARSGCNGILMAGCIRWRE